MSLYSCVLTMNYVVFTRSRVSQVLGAAISWSNTVCNKHKISRHNIFSEWVLVWFIASSETCKKYSISEPISCLLSSLYSEIAKKKVTGLKVEYCYTEEVFPYLLAFKLSETVIINQQFYQSWIINPFILALRKINVRQVYQNYFWFCLIRRHQSPEPEPDWSILPKSKRQWFKR